MNAVIDKFTHILNTHCVIDFTFREEANISEVFNTMIWSVIAIQTFLTGPVVHTLTDVTS